MESKRRRRLKFFALGLSVALTGSCISPLQTPPLAEVRPLALKLQPLPLEREAPGATRVGKLTYLSGFALSSDDDFFGGLSAAAFAPGGDLYAVSDRGSWFRFPLLHDAAGRLTGIGAATAGGLTDGFGRMVRGSDVDSESLTPRTDGAGFYVGFERNHRIWRYDLATDDGWPAAVSGVVQAGVLDQLPKNLGLEAMAALPEGRLLAFAEYCLLEGERCPGWIFSPGAPERPVFLQESASFKPTDLALGPDQAVYLMERRFSYMGGFNARLRRIPLAELKSGEPIKGEVLAEFDSRHSTDNMEALAVRAGQNGHILFYMASDDNFLSLQRTVLMQFDYAPEEQEKR